MKAAFLRLGTTITHEAFCQRSCGMSFSGIVWISRRTLAASLMRSTFFESAPTSATVPNRTALVATLINTFMNKILPKSRSSARLDPALHWPGAQLADAVVGAPSLVGLLGFELACSVNAQSIDNDNDCAATAIGARADAHRDGRLPTRLHPRRGGRGVRHRRTRRRHGRDTHGECRGRQPGQACLDRRAHVRPHVG